MQYNLFVNYYIDKNSVRQQELEFCITENLKNESLNYYVVICNSNEYDNFLSKYADYEKKIIPVIIDKRPTYNDYFQLITKLFPQEDNINIVSNLDIIIPKETLLYSTFYLSGKSCLALTRWDIINKVDYIKNSNLFDRPDTQDTWIFKGAVPQISGATFTLGTAGCLDGETEILYKRGKRKGGRKIKIKDLYKRFNGITKNWKIKDITTTQSLCLEKDFIFYNKILSVTQSGLKETIKITLEDNSSLILTPDHKILNENKEFISAENLKIGEYVCCKGNMKMNKIREKRIYRDRKVVYIKYHPYAENKIIRGHKYKRVRKYRLVYEANMNNLKYEDYIYCLKNDIEKAKKLKYLNPKIEIHHIDGNTTNDTLENLEICTKEEHAKLHSNNIINHRQYIQKKKIIRIEKHNEVMTYDISVESPNNNFSANNIIVHNCDNSIAHLLSVAEYEVKNPSRNLKTFHYHLTNIRNYLDISGQATEIISPPYKLLPPTL
jgi:hypothetical protein